MTLYTCELEALQAFINDYGHEYKNNVEDLVIDFNEELSQTDSGLYYLNYQEI